MLAATPTGRFVFDLPALIVGLLLGYVLMRREVRRGKQGVSNRFYLIMSGCLLVVMALIDTLAFVQH